jgi:hypothetical protein
MRRVRYGVGMSLDGFIADAKGGTAYLVSDGAARARVHGATRAVEQTHAADARQENETCEATRARLMRDVLAAMGYAPEGVIWDGRRYR